MPLYTTSGQQSDEDIPVFVVLFKSSGHPVECQKMINSNFAMYPVNYMFLFHEDHDTVVEYRLYEKK